MNNRGSIRVAQIVGKWVGGGVESFIMNYYRYINHDKFQFDFICDEDSTCIPYDEIEKLGGRVILVPPYQKIFKYQKVLTGVLKNGNYQIVHSHINTLSVFSLMAAKRAGIKIRIAHSHSTTNKKEFKKNIIKQILRPFSRVFATDYFACSEDAGRWLFGNKIYDEGKVFVLNNAIEIDNFKYDEFGRKEIRQELNISDNTFVIGHVGRFMPVKNQLFLLDLFAKIHQKNNNTVLILVGQGPMENEIREKIVELKIEPWVKLVGQRNDVNKLYQAMDVLVLPSLYEGLGMVLLEAQVSNLPCVCSNNIPHIVNVTNLIEFVNLDTPENQWCDIILSKIGIERKTNVYMSGSDYNIKNEANKMALLYEKLLNKRKLG
jgi:glycosyltransferase involved in cell wall biosynthesis